MDTKETKNLFDTISTIYEATHKDFKQTNGKHYINTNDTKNRHGLVLVYAPWCSHCKKSVNLFDYISKSLHDYGIRVSTVNSENKKDKNDILVKDLGVTTFPTIFTVNKDHKNNMMSGLLNKYNGERNINDLFMELYTMKNNM